jgi:DNA polymerase-1
MRDVGEKGAVIESMGAEELCLYNGQDCRLTGLAWNRMQGDLDKERWVYEHDLELARVCHEMQWVGVGVDEARRNTLMGALRARKRELRNELRRLARRPSLAPGKLGDIREVLFDQFGAVGLKRTPAGQLSTADETLEALAGDTPLGKFAEALLTWRLVGKILSTYLAAVDVLGGRAHYNWKPFGTVSGRLACRMQSCPRWDPSTPEGRAREIYVPRDGNVFVYFDVSQAEMRLAAFLANDPVFMKVATTSDVHAGNAKAVFPDIAAKGWLDGDAKKDPARGKPYRDIAKSLGFAIAYGAEEDKVFSTLRRKGFPVKMRQVALILGRLRAAYKVYYRYVADNVERVRIDGYMRSPVLGRIRWFGRYPKPTDISNYPVQSALADIVNRRMIALGRRLAREGDCPLVMQHHDACVYDVPRRKAGMVERMISEAWAEPVTLAGGDLTLPIDLKRGDRWSEL